MHLGKLRLGRTRLVQGHHLGGTCGCRRGLVWGSVRPPPAANQEAQEAAPPPAHRPCQLWVSAPTSRPHLWALGRRTSGRRRAWGAPLDGWTVQKASRPPDQRPRVWDGAPRPRNGREGDLTVPRRTQMHRCDWMYLGAVGVLGWATPLSGLSGGGLPTGVAQPLRPRSPRHPVPWTRDEGGEGAPAAVLTPR